MSRNRQYFTRHDTFISFDLKVGNQRGKRHLKAIVDAINAEHAITRTDKQEDALGLILLNAIYTNYKPLIISLNNNSYKTYSRYNHSGVGITVFKTIYEKLESEDLVYTRYAAFPGLNVQESTVIEVDGLKQYCLAHAEQIKQYIHQKAELIILRKTTKKYLWEEGKVGSIRNTVPCEYKDTDNSYAARRFLRDYNQWIAHATITFDIQSANAARLFQQPRYIHYTPEQIKAYIFTYFHKTALRRIYIAPEDYEPNEPRPLPKLGGRFYGSFWQDAMPSDFRKYLLVDGEPCIELDFRAMNVTMLYLEKLKHPWESYPYEFIPVPSNPEIDFPKDVVKPFFTWCLNVRTRQSALNLLRSQLSDELAKNDDTKQYKDFLKNNDISYSEYIDAVLNSQPEIADEFFNEEITGRKLQFHDSEILERIMRECMEVGIYCFPIHDAVLVQERHKDQVKELMVRALCEYFDAEFKPEYVGLLVKEKCAERDLRPRAYRTG